MGIVENTAFERETVINFSDAEPGIINVWTSQRRIGQWLEKLAKLTTIDVKRTGRPTWECSLPSNYITLRKGPKKPMTPEQRAAKVEQLAEMNKRRREGGSLADKTPEAK